MLPVETETVPNPELAQALTAHLQQRQALGLTPAQLAWVITLIQLLAALGPSAMAVLPKVTLGRPKTNNSTSEAAHV